MNKAFWKLNGKPILLLVCIAIFFILFMVFFVKYNATISDDFRRLVEEGNNIQGNIIEIKILESVVVHNRSGDKPKIIPEGVRVVIDYQGNDLEMNKLYEEWSIEYKDAYVVGSSVDLLYLPSNAKVKISSVNNKVIKPYILHSKKN